MRRVSYLLLLFLGYIGAIIGQSTKVTLSGGLRDNATKEGIAYANVVLLNAVDSSFVTGSITDDVGYFVLSDLRPGEYRLSATYIGYGTLNKAVFIGSMNNFLDLGYLDMEQGAALLDEIIVEGRQDAVSRTMDKMVFVVDNNISQSGGSVLQVMQNVPSVSVTQDGKIELRGSDKVAVLVDGKQTALTGFGNQTSLDNIPASAIERIEVINNPSAVHDAQGSAGIINIIFKKDRREGWNGKLGMTTGIGALGVKRENLPTIRDQNQGNLKLNPSLSLNYRKDKLNWFFQGDYLSQRVLNKNEFFQREYNDGTFIEQQFLENRQQVVTTLRTGLDLSLNDRNTLTLSGMFYYMEYIDDGDLPYFNRGLTQRNRLWQYTEVEDKTAGTATVVYEHKFKQPGHKLGMNFNYTFQRKNEIFDFDNFLPSSTGNDLTVSVADEKTADLTVDYVKPLRLGRLELGSKLRLRNLPTIMEFVSGQNSILDLDAQGKAVYDEYVAALYGNYLFETKDWEFEAGLRLEYVTINYDVQSQHSAFRSGGYDYFQPFPNLRATYKLSDNSRFSFFYNRRVDRPDERDLRIFPKYDDPEILKVGNSNLQPQFTQRVELGYKSSWGRGFLYSAVYARFVDNILTRIVTAPLGSTQLNAISQNAGSATNVGIEWVLDQELNRWLSVNANINAFKNTISAFSIENVYPLNVPFSAMTTEIYSGNLKINALFKLARQWDVQLTNIYLAPDLIPQGRIESRYSLDVGVRRRIQKGSGELFMNASDILNTMRIKKVVTATGFTLRSIDLFETQIIRVGYSYKF